jgi:hypothetical protein
VISPECQVDTGILQYAAKQKEKTINIKTMTIAKVILKRYSLSFLLVSILRTK